MWRCLETKLPPIRFTRVEKTTPFTRKHETSHSLTHTYGLAPFLFPDHAHNINITLLPFAPRSLGSPTCPKPWAFVWSSRRTTQITLVPHKATLPEPGAKALSVDISPLQVVFSAAPPAPRAMASAPTEEATEHGGAADPGGEDDAGAGTPDARGGAMVHFVAGADNGATEKLARMMSHAEAAVWRGAFHRWRDSTQDQRLSAVEQILRRFDPAACKLAVA